jgi:hypothetical protein
MFDINESLFGEHRLDFSFSSITIGDLHIVVFGLDEIPYILQEINHIFDELFDWFTGKICSCMLGKIPLFVKSENIKR